VLALPTLAVPSRVRPELAEEAAGQMRRSLGKALATLSSSFGKQKMPILDHIALHAASAPGGATQRELADLLGVSHGHVTGIIDRMAASHLVQRMRDAHDRRVIHVKATRHGLHQHRAAHTADNPQLMMLFEGWSEEDIRTFMRLLAQLRVPKTRSVAPSKSAEPSPSGRVSPA